MRDLGTLRSSARAAHEVMIISREALVASALSHLLSETGLTVLVGDISPGAGDEITRACTRAGVRTPVIIYDVAADLPAALASIAAVGTRLRVVALTPTELLSAVPALLDAGTAGIVGRDATPEELLRAVTDVAAGHVFASQLVLREMLSLIARVSHGEPSSGGGQELLAPREREVVRLLTRGMTNREIAATLHLSEATVKAHLGRVMTKWNVRDRLQVALRAVGRREQRTETLV